MNDGKLSLNETKVSSNMASLEHPTTLRIFLYCLDKMNSISVREAQRDLELNSPNTVTWHFEKLLRDNLIERGSNSQYNITEIGSSQRSFSLPTQLQYRYIRGKLIPLKYFQFGFLLSTLVLSLLLAIYSISLAFAVAIFSLFIMLLISLGEFYKYLHYPDLFE